MDILKVCKDGPIPEYWISHPLSGRYEVTRPVLFAGKIIVAGHSIQAWRGTNKYVITRDFGDYPVIMHPHSCRFGVVNGVLFVCNLKMGKLYRSTNGLDLIEDKEVTRFNSFEGGVVIAGEDGILSMTIDAVNWIRVGGYCEASILGTVLNGDHLFVSGFTSIWSYDLSTRNVVVHPDHTVIACLPGYHKLIKRQNEVYLHSDCEVLRWDNGKWISAARFEGIRSMVDTDYGIAVLTSDLRIHILGTTDSIPTVAREIVVLEDGNVYDVGSKRIVLHHKMWNLADFKLYSPYRRKRTRTVLLSCRRFGICFGLFHEIICFV